MYKKWFSLVASVIIACSMVTGCGDSAGNDSTAEENNGMSEGFELSSEDNIESDEAVETTTAPTTTTKVTTTKAPSNEVEYIGEMSVQYNKEKDLYEVSFCLSDANKQALDASGTAKIKITDVQGNTLYDKSINFTKSDFRSWTNRFRDDSSYGCWLTISRNDIDGASSESGTLSLKVSGDDYEFSSEKLSIDDLPQKQATLTLPDTPISITDLRYHSHTSYATVSDITFESENDYDGNMTLTLKMIITLDNKKGEENVADNVAIGYKLTDSEGFVAATGTIRTDNLRVGEKTKEEEKVYDLDPSESYTLTLEDVS